MKKTGAALVLMFCVGVSYAQIYRWTDSQGVIHFSDKPHPGAVPVEVSVPQSFTPPVRNTPTPQAPPESKSNEDRSYNKVMITQPESEATIRNNEGYVLVGVELEPSLKTGDKLQMVFDGQPLGTPQANLAFQLNAIERGKHTIAIQVLDSEGAVLNTSDSITFFMHRPRVGMGANSPGKGGGGGGAKTLPPATSFP